MGQVDASTVKGRRDNRPGWGERSPCHASNRPEFFTPGRRRGTRGAVLLAGRQARTAGPVPPCGRGLCRCGVPGAPTGGGHLRPAGRRRPACRAAAHHGARRQSVRMEQLGNLVHFGQRGLTGILDAGELLADTQDSLAHRVGWRAGRTAGWSQASAAWPMVPGRPGNPWLPATRTAAASCSRPRSATTVAHRITGMPGKSTCAGSRPSSAPACSPRPRTRCANGAPPSAPQPPVPSCRLARRG